MIALSRINTCFFALRFNYFCCGCVLHSSVKHFTTLPSANLLRLSLIESPVSANTFLVNFVLAGKFLCPLL